MLRTPVYQALTSCQKSKRSLRGKYHNFLTPRQTETYNLGCKLHWSGELLPGARALFGERNMVLTCGFRGKLDNTLNFHFQWQKASVSLLDFKKKSWTIQKTLKMRRSGVLQAPYILNKSSVLPHFFRDDSPWWWFSEFLITFSQRFSVFYNWIIQNLKNRIEDI